MVNILVTGSSGFIGLNVSNFLHQRGHNVCGIDVSKPPIGLNSGIKTLKKDLTTNPDLPEVEVIIHLAAHSQVQAVVDDPNRIVENIEMTTNVLEAAKQMGAFVLNVSSRDVYGNAIRPSENELELAPPNGYAASKVASEAITRSYGQTHNVPYTSLRLSNVYGPMDVNARVIPIFVALADEGDTLSVFGEDKLVDFVHVSDISEIITDVVEQRAVANGEAFNIGSGNGTPLTKIAEFISKNVDSCQGWSVSTNRDGDVTQYVSDISKASAMLGFEPKTSIEDGLEETIEWYLDNQDCLREVREQL